MLQTRMSLQMRTDVTKRLKILHREKSAVSQCGIQTRSCVSLGKNETVTLRILRVLRINIHFFKIKIRKYVCCGKRSARMTGFGSMNTRNDALSHLNSHLLKF